ncbi:hypothetical protein [Nonomuraea dietziae]|uniref:hypothetical protein n=1 Tax=Nonomuraea dietziae TaxID=65515 RepID=UPI0033E62E12
MGGQTQFITAAGMVSAASLAVPQVRPMVPVFWSLVASPENMIGGAQRWLDSTAPPTMVPKAPFVEKPGGGAKADEWHPPMQTDIALLRAELRKLLTEAKAKNHYKGDSATAFERLFEELDAALEHLAELRKGVGASLESAASLYKAAADVLMAIAVFVSALALASLAVRFVPVAWLAFNAQVMAIAFKLNEAVIRVASVLGKLSFKLAFMLIGIGTISSGIAAKFPGMQPIKGQAPAFTQAQAVWEQEKLTIKKAPDLGLSDLNKKGGGGMGNLIPGMP